MDLAYATLTCSLVDPNKQDLGALNRSLSALTASKTSMSENKTLLRAIAQLPVGRAFTGVAQKLVEGAAWYTSQVAKVTEMQANIEKAITEKLFVKLEAVHVELRVMFCEKDVRTLVAGQHDLLVPQNEVQNRKHRPLQLIVTW